MMKPIYLTLFITAFFLANVTACVAQPGKKFDKVRAFVPPVYDILDVVSGDMNEDGFIDYAMVLRNENEDINGDELRPLLIITGEKHGQFILFERNDSVVLCRSCGGVFGDPFQHLTFKDRLLTIEHNVGNSWRWSRNISFRYDPILQDFVLNDDTFLSYQKFNSTKQTAVVTTKDAANKQRFKTYSFSKNQR